MRYSPEHKEQSREKILEAARQLFRSRGFEGASIDQVMHAAGLTRGAFYAHFTSKDDLVRQVLAIEAGLLTPPFGLLVYTVKAAIQDDSVSIVDIFRGSIPYWIIMLAGIVAIVLVPEIATRLPSLLF